MTDQEEKRASNAAIGRMAFDAVLTIAVLIVGFWVNGIKDEIKDVRDTNLRQDTQVASIKERLPIDYVRQETYVREMAEFRAILLRIEGKIESRHDRDGATPRPFSAK